MVYPNKNLEKLPSNYLFPEILRKTETFQKLHPDADLISLSIGDTTQAIPLPIARAMADAAHALAEPKTYTGYESERSSAPLRQEIASEFYKGISADEIFLHDGAKPDIGRLQAFFGPDVTIAIQDPCYPVYLEGSLLAGVRKENIFFMPCTPENNFFPDLSRQKKTDLIYFCSPNNPTGSVADKEQLTALVEFAKENHSIILFDAAYAPFIRDPSLPKSIYEIKGAEETAIEINSFSKFAGFTGVRLGWTVVPKTLLFEDGSSVRNRWNRFLNTVFNGASNIARQGGSACLQPENRKELQRIIRFYSENAGILKEALSPRFQTFSGVNAPYLWIYCGKKSSEEYFDYFLREAHIVTTPGSAFGKSGEGFLRITSFGSRATILKAAERIKRLVPEGSLMSSCP